MLLTKEIEVKINKQNIEHFKKMRFNYNLKNISENLNLFLKQMNK